MLGSVFGKKSRTEDLKKIYAGLLKKCVNMGLQAALLTSAALTAELTCFEQELERSEQELSRAKKQLQDKEGE